MNQKIVVLFALVVMSMLLFGCTTKEKFDYASFGLVEDGVLTVGSDIPYEPMEFYDENGELAGIDIDIVKEIATDLGLELKVVNIGWDDLFVAVENGEVDLAIAAITINPERSENMLFSIPYFNGGQVMVVRLDYDNVLLVEDLDGKKIGVQVDTTSMDEALKYTDEELVFTYDGYEKCEGEDIGVTCDLKNGLLDVIIVDYLVAADLVKNYDEFKIVGEPFTQEFYGIATKLDNDALMSSVNSILRDLKLNEKLDEIENKWI